MFGSLRLNSQRRVAEYFAWAPILRRFYCMSRNVQLFRHSLGHNIQIQIHARHAFPRSSVLSESKASKLKKSVPFSEAFRAPLTKFFLSTNSSDVLLRVVLSAWEIYAEIARQMKVFVLIGLTSSPGWFGEVTRLRHRQIAAHITKMGSNSAMPLVLSARN